MAIILFVIIIAVLILVHELGHFSVAKKAGIRVDEFGIGFPPRIFGKKKGETTYSVNWIPFGGFVKIFGEDPNDESIHGPDRERSFVHQPKITQAAVLGAGVAFNVFLAWFLFSATFVAGIPAPVGVYESEAVKNPQVIITSVVEGSPAEGAGLRIGDAIVGLEIEGERIRDVAVEDVQNFVGRADGREVGFVIVRGGEEAMLFAMPETDNELGRAIVGIAMDTLATVRLPIHRAAVEGGRLTFESLGATAVGFATLIRDAFTGGAALESVTGPVGIVGIVGDATRFGLVNLVGLTAFISINLAIINLIPFPALDGGRLFFLLIETLKRSPINPKFANAANAVGFFILIALMLVVTYNDVVRLF